MAITSNERERIRVTILPKELEKWVPKDTPQSMVKHYIDLGREREQLRDHLDQRFFELQQRYTQDSEKLQVKNALLRKKIDDLTELFCHVAHLLVISSSVDH